MLVAFIFLIIGAIDYIPSYGIKWYPTGHFFGTFFIGVVAYTIVKHKLLDINIVFKKSLVYSSFITSITLIYIISILAFEQIFHTVIGYKNILWSFFTTILIALILIPLKNRIQGFVDRIFFRKSTFEIENENILLRQELTQTERLKSVAILASGMAHEIKNPLTALKTISEYLPKKGSDPEFIKKFAPLMSQEVDRINNLVHELLEFAKPAPVNPQPTDIHQLINNTLELLNNALIKYKIILNKEFLAPLDQHLNIDHNQFKQALLNILLNAIEVMPNGGTLSISTLVQDEHFIIKIQDTGPGIAKEDLSHIFDPFFTKKANGTGLGLSITHEIIKNHNGKIFVESVLDKGTTFNIQLSIPN